MTTHSSTASAGPPRIPPGGRAELGYLNLLIARILGVATGGHPPNLFTTLGRHRRLFRKWLRFAGGLMPGGVLPRADTELTILRVAHNAGCEYEWSHHQRLARVAGLSTEEVERTRSGPGAPGWSARQRLILRAADELQTTRGMSDELWAQLRPLMSDPELIELCLLVGHYEMLAITLGALRVAPDPPAGGRAARLLARVGRRN